MTPTQLPDESSRAFAAFKTYLADGPKRSIRRCARKLRKSATICARWSKKHRWQKRLREAELDDGKRAIKADEQAKLSVAKERERAQLKFQERALEVSQKMTARGLQILKQPLKGTKPADAARLLNVADAIGRAALGLEGAAGAAFGLHPIEPPNMTVVHCRDDQSDVVDAIQRQFLRDNPDDPAAVGRIDADELRATAATDAELLRKRHGRDQSNDLN
jgi:hypothetical protein